MNATSASIAPFVRLLVTAALAAGALAGCGWRPAPRPSVEVSGGLRLLGAAAYRGGELSLPGLPPFGSLSGLAHDPTSGEWAGAIDDTVPQRLGWMHIAFGPTATITPTKYTLIHAGPGTTADTMAGLEMESLVALPDGTFVTATEGYHDAENLVHQAEVVFIDRQGAVTGAVRPRPHFAITPGVRSRGVRHNLGLESLTRTPDGRLLSGLEQPLVQDGAMSSRTRGGVVRLIEFVEQPSTGWAPGREWAYRLEPTATVRGYDRPCSDGENGLSDMLALSNDVWLTLERACLLGAPGVPAYNPVRVFEVTVAGASDVSGITSIAGRRLRLAKKRLVLDVNALASRLPSLLATGSNFEGLACGPAGPNGERTVVLVSDDNLRATQTTALLWLALPR